MSDGTRPPSWFLVVRANGEVVCGCGNEASAVSFAKAYDEPTNPSRVVPVWERDPDEAAASARLYMQKVDAILERVGDLEYSVRVLKDYAGPFCRGCGCDGPRGERRGRL